MDKNIMELWGNMFINAAKSQKQMEEMTAWFHKSMSTFNDMTSTFRKAYGLDTPPTPNSEESKSWNKMIDEFQQLFVNGCLSLMGIKPVPEGHLDLIKKYEALKEKVASQEETIRHLRMLLEEARNANYTKATLHIEDLIQKQSDQFQTMMSNFGQLGKLEKTPEEG